MFSVDVRNDAIQHLQAVAPDNARQAMRYALASTAKFLREILKTEGKTASRGGYLGWPTLSPFTGTLNQVGARKWVSSVRGRGKGRYRFGQGKTGGDFNPLNLSAKTDPMTRLVSAIRSLADSGTMTTQIGFVDPRVGGLVAMQAAGYGTAITPRMRRMFFAIGLAIPADKTQITDPSRAWIMAVYQREQGNLMAHFQQRFYWGFGQLEGGSTKIVSPIGASVLL